MSSITKLLFTTATLTMLAQASPTLAQTAGCDYTDADRYGGWGWNNSTSESCPPLNENQTNQTQPTDCDYSNAVNGWGWNPITSQSCPPATTSNPGNGQTVTPTDGTPTCQSASADPDGDGWGWENNNTCRVSNETTQPGSVCDDPDGDGWGWDGTASCRVGEVVVTNPEPGNPEPGNECIDPDGDGYGWNGTESCVVGEIEVPVSMATSSCDAPASGSVFVSSTTPVRSTGNGFYPDRGPQCVWPANRFNGPGLFFGDFQLINNAWNGDKSSFDWSQCIALTETNGAVNPSWTYDWGNENDLQPGFFEWEVKSFPEIIYGVKSRSEQSAACEDTGLPVTISQMPQIDITYSYTAVQTNNRIGDLGDEANNPPTVRGGDRNIALESFLHSSCDIRRGADSNRQFELMVWLDKGNERRPSGSPPVSVYTDSQGRDYDVYVKGADDPGYIAYVAQQEQTSGTLDWNEFFTDAQSNAGTYGVRRIQDNWCLGNILFGTEIWWGEGSFELDQYEITRSY